MPAFARRRVPVALATLLTLLALAACGSSGSPPKSDASASQDTAGLKFAQCMRANGVPHFPDPGGGGGGFKFQLNAGAGVNPSSPAFQAAQVKCRSLLPGGGPVGGHPSAQAKAQMLAMSECMRRHGVTGFPDPTASPPSSPAGFSVVIGRGGVFVAVPRTIDVRSPVFQKAAAACAFPH
jgi:hypothetical protein